MRMANEIQRLTDRKLLAEKLYTVNEESTEALREHIEKYGTEHLSTSLYYDAFDAGQTDVMVLLEDHGVTPKYDSLILRAVSSHAELWDLFSNYAALEHLLTKAPPVQFT